MHDGHHPAIHPVQDLRSPGTDCEFCWLRVPHFLYWPLYQPHRLGRIKERLADTQRPSLHFALQRECILAVSNSDVAVFEVIMDVLSRERVKRQDAVTDLRLLLIREVRYDEPVADVYTELVAASSTCRV